MNLLLVHKICVWIFVLIYLIKTILLFTNNNDGLAKFTKMVKVPEMIVSAGFLLTGFYQLYLLGAIKSFQIMKLIAVFASIPIAIIGFKKRNKMLAGLAMFLILMSYGLAEMARKQKAIGNETVAPENANATVDGKQIYAANCVLCHGDDGQKGYNGAANLHTSSSSNEMIINVITNGKNAMMPYKEMLSTPEIEAVSAYVISLR